MSKLINESKIRATIEAVVATKGKNLPKGQWFNAGSDPCEAMVKPLANSKGSIIVLREVNDQGKIGEVGLIYMPVDVPSKSFIDLTV